jgi:hypothetical protein
MNRAREVDTEAIDLLLYLVKKGVEIECHYTEQQLRDYQEKFTYERENDFLPEYLYSTIIGMDNPPKRWLDMVAAYFAPPCRIGIDLARFGSSETVFAVRRNWRVVEIRPRFNLDAVQIVAHAKELYNFYAGTDLILVDKTGLSGEMGVADPMIKEDYPVVAIGFGEQSNCREDYRNIATEMWFEIADNIDIMMLPYDLQLMTQLSTRRYTFTGKDMQKVVEPKEAMRRRKLPSPDRADAVCLAFHKVVIVEEDEDDDVREDGNYIDGGFNQIEFK